MDWVWTLPSNRAVICDPEWGDWGWSMAVNCWEIRGYQMSEESRKVPTDSILIFESNQGTFTWEDFMFEYGLQITFTILDWKEVDGSVTVSDNIYHQLKKKKKTSKYLSLEWSGQPVCDQYNLKSLSVKINWRTETVKRSHFQKFKLNKNLYTDINTTRQKQSSYIILFNKLIHIINSYPFHKFLDILL